VCCRRPVARRTRTIGDSHPGDFEMSVLRIVLIVLLIVAVAGALLFAIAPRVRAQLLPGSAETAALADAASIAAESAEAAAKAATEAAESAAASDDPDEAAAAADDAQRAAEVAEQAAYIAADRADAAALNEAAEKGAVGDNASAIAAPVDSAAVAQAKTAVEKVKQAVGEAKAAASGAAAVVASRGAMAGSRRRRWQPTFGAAPVDAWTPEQLRASARTYQPYDERREVRLGGDEMRFKYHDDREQLSAGTMLARGARAYDANVPIVHTLRDPPSVRPEDFDAASIGRIAPFDIRSGFSIGPVGNVHVEDRLARPVTPGSESVCGGFDMSTRDVWTAPCMTRSSLEAAAAARRAGRPLTPGDVDRASIGRVTPGQPPLFVDGAPPAQMRQLYGDAAAQQLSPSARHCTSCVA